MYSFASFAGAETFPAEGTPLAHAAGLELERVRIPDGDAGAERTVSHMARLIVEGSRSALVRRQAVMLASSVQERDYTGQIAALRAWIAGHVAFLRDIEGTELLHEAELMVWSIQQGGRIHVDCDDVGILAGALGKSIGLLARIVTVAFSDPAAPGAVRTPYAHTWVELASPVGEPDWLELDTTRGAQSFDLKYVARWFIVEV